MSYADFKFQAIVSSESDYKQLISDLVCIGYEDRNPYSEQDEDGQAITTQFITIDFKDNELHNLFGLKSTWRTSLEDFKNRYPDDELDQEDLDRGYVDVFFDEATFVPENMEFDIQLREEYIDPYPLPEDYPILVSIQYEDSFDRLGSLKIRNCKWISMAKLPIYNPQTIRDRKALWESKYQEKWEAILAREDAMGKQELRSCNLHQDCDVADKEAQERGQPWARHCNDDCCEDCFGS